jgi:hypothetical protein
MAPIRIRIQIDEKGSVIAARVRGGEQTLFSSAMRCVEHSEYRPFVKDGKPVVVTTDVEIMFSGKTADPDFRLYEKNRAAAYRAIAAGELDRAAELYQKNIDIAEHRQPALQLEIAEAASDLGHLRMKQGKTDDAEKLLKQAIAAYDKQGERESPQIGRALEELGGIYLKKKEYKKSEPLLTRALNIFTKGRTAAISPQMKTYASASIQRALFGLAALNYLSGNLQAADTYCEKTLKETRDADLESAELKQVFDNCAGVKRALGQAAKEGRLEKQANSLK